MPEGNAIRAELAEVGPCSPMCANRLRLCPRGLAYLGPCMPSLLAWVRSSLGTRSVCSFVTCVLVHADDKQDQHAQHIHQRQINWWLQ